MKSQFVIASTTAFALLSGGGCVSNGSPRTLSTAQSHDDAGCSSHHKQCDNQDWCAKNAGKCSIGSQ
jgi:hypothetical protein